MRAGTGWAWSISGKNLYIYPRILRMKQELSTLNMSKTITTKKYVDRVTKEEKEYVPFGSKCKMFELSNFYGVDIEVDYSKIPTAMPFEQPGKPDTLVDVNSLIPTWLCERDPIVYPSVEHAWHATGILMRIGDIDTRPDDELTKEEIEERDWQEEEAKRVIALFEKGGKLSEWKSLKKLGVKETVMTENMKTKGLVGLIAKKFIGVDEEVTMEKFGVSNEKRWMRYFDFNKPLMLDLKMAGLFKHFLELKFADEKLEKILMDTKDLLLVEQCRWTKKIERADKELFWGAVRCAQSPYENMLFGKNFMGFALMQVRKGLLGVDVRQLASVSEITSDERDQENDDDDDECMITGISQEEDCVIVDVYPDDGKLKRRSKESMWKDWVEEDRKKKKQRK
jgi:hypothetical protein